ncbi:2-oxo acid dehydrogenase subunit E2 [Halobellus litoreus]|uniref:2-oxo acid dehydrogenase subunit E2 n=1 Tax=Halobellus litoreus TaxID=755310 RepID=A0ABD6DRD2_9EURY
MGYVVRMPKLGLEMESGTLLEWFVEEGESVEDGAVLAEIESEKTTAEVDARESGVLRRVLLDAGETVSPGTPIGILAEDEADIADLIADAEADLGDAAESTAATAPDEPEATASAETGGSPDATATEPSAASGAPAKASPRARKRADELGVDLAEVDGTGPQGAVTEDDVEASAGAASGADAAGGEVRASPRATKRAEDLGVALAAVTGSGPQGAITEDDVEAHAESAGEATQAEQGPGATRTVVEERAFDGMRRTIAKRLSESYREAVHVTEHREVDAGELLAAADAAEAALDAEVSMTDVLFFALSDALDEHPAFNATFEDDTHRLYAEHNVCLAVDVEQGLVTPVIPDVGGKSLSALAAERREVVERTLDGDYTMGDLQGGTFTVTNLGVLGVESFDPIINPPQIAILGVNTLLDRVVMGEDGTPETRRVLPLDLSFDHRVVDGADAARFLGTLADNIEDPWPLLPEAVAAEREAGAAGTAGASAPRTATAHSAAGMSGSVRTRGTEQRYGDGPEPSPVDLFLGSLAACLSLSIRYQVEMRDVSVGDIDVETDADPESGSVESVDITVRLDAPEADDETLDRVVEYGERSCHVAELLREDLPVELTWERR